MRYVASVFALLLACADSARPAADEPFNPVQTATSPGDWGVGHGETEVSYVDPLGAERSLRTSVWWPTEDTGGFAATYFYGSAESKVAIEDASVATGPFPLVVFSHGHQAYAEVSSFFAEHLASHGFLVVAPDHTNNTTLDGGDRDTEIYLQRPADISAVIDALSAGTLPVATTQFNGQVVVTGHSFGGYTAFALAGAVYDPAAITADCEGKSSGICTSWDESWVPAFEAGGADDRVLGMMAMAPGDFGLFGAAGAAAIDVPTYLLTGELDPEHSADGADYWAAIAPGGHRYASIATAGHNAFTDFSGVLDDGGSIEPERGFSIVNAFLLAFSAELCGDDRYTSLLSGEAEVDSLVTVH